LEALSAFQVQKEKTTIRVISKISIFSFFCVVMNLEMKLNPSKWFFHSFLFPIRFNQIEQSIFMPRKSTQVWLIKILQWTLQNLEEGAETVSRGDSFQIGWSSSGIRDHSFGTSCKESSSLLLKWCLIQ
jgi:hypothetical protein